MIPLYLNVTPTTIADKMSKTAMSVPTNAASDDERQRWLESENSKAATSLASSYIFTCRVSKATHSFFYKGHREN